MALFSLTLPRSVVPQTSGIPDQCLSLPPTMSVGKVLEASNHAQYAQPRISYRLVALAHVHLPDGDVHTVKGGKEISVMPCSEPSPPVEVADFPDEYVSLATNSFRTSLFGAQYLMTLFMAEPTPISIGPMKRQHKTTVRLSVEARAAAGRELTTNLYPLHQALRDLTFKVQPILRVKTYYSTKPFPMLPSQKMVTADGPIRLHDSVVRMVEVEVMSTSWQPKFLDEVPCYEEAVRSASVSSRSSETSSARRSSQSSVKPPNSPSQVLAWTASLNVPVELSGTILPTFCSAIASRQYSLIARIRLKGASIKQFVLEAPLQVHHSPCAVTPGTAGGDEPFTRESALFEHTQHMHDLLNDDLVST